MVIWHSNDKKQICIFRKLWRTILSQSPTRNSEMTITWTRSKLKITSNSQTLPKYISKASTNAHVSDGTKVNNPAYDHSVPGSNPGLNIFFFKLIWICQIGKGQNLKIMILIKINNINVRSAQRPYSPGLYKCPNYRKSFFSLFISLYFFILDCNAWLI